MSTRRPALIFDFGNVVAFFDYTRGIAALARRLRVEPAEFLARIAASDLPALARTFESGAISSDEFSRTARKRAGLSDLSHDEFASLWADIFWLNEPVATLVRALRERSYPLVIGSNTNELHARQFRRQFAETLAFFDGQVLSFEIGHCKPSAEFYHACARAAGAEPAACVFIDDTPGNVEGARAAGLQGVLYRDPSSLLSDLRDLGVEVAGVEL
jgi:FMN phosphatase YigB (HAD superfamily)